jgi:hypothetical protein
MATGMVVQPGPYCCMDMLRLADFVPSFEQWNIRTRIEEKPLPDSTLLTRLSDDSECRH